MRIPLKHYFSNSNREFEIEISTGDSAGHTYDPNKRQGFYAEFAGETIGLCAINDRLFVLLEGKALAVGESFSICYETSVESSKLEIQNGTERYLIAYGNENAPVSTQFYSEDMEDADFGLWLSNVLNSKERKTAILKSWSSGM